MDNNFFLQELLTVIIATDNSANESKKNDTLSLSIYSKFFLNYELSIRMRLLLAQLKNIKIF